MNKLSTAAKLKTESFDQSWKLTDFVNKNNITKEIENINNKYDLNFVAT